MKFFVIGKRKETITSEQFAEYLDLEAEMAIQLFREEFIRELYSIKGGKGACMIIEASSEEEISIVTQIAQEARFIKEVQNFVKVNKDKR